MAGLARPFLFRLSAIAERRCPGYVRSITNGASMLRISRDLVIDEDDIEIGFVRASGPGGQNVTKVATSAQLRFDTRKLTLPEDAALRLEAQRCILRQGQLARIEAQ